MKVTETKINDEAAKNAPGVPRGRGGSRTTLGVPWRAQGTPSKALPMRSLSKLKKGMGYENACLATEGRGTHFFIPYLS